MTAIVVTNKPIHEFALPVCTAFSSRPSSGSFAFCWDKIRRELRLDGMLIKRFRQPSPNQEKILSAFQEEGWPSFIDDPLPQDPEQDPKRRLNHTIRNLNRGHKNNFIRFQGDGTGERVLLHLLLRTIP